MEIVKPIGGLAVQTRLTNELAQVQDDHAQMIRDLADLSKKMQTALADFDRACKGASVKLPVAAQVAIDKMAAYAGALPQ